MQEIELTPELKTFHALVSAYMAGRAYRDACAALAEATPTHDEKGQPVKGNKTFVGLCLENEQRSIKHIKAIVEHFNKMPGFASLAESMVAQFEVNMQAMVELSPTGQARVHNLIEKIKKDKAEIDFWNSLKPNNG